MPSLTVAVPSASTLTAVGLFALRAADLLGRAPTPAPVIYECPFEGPPVADVRGGAVALAECQARVAELAVCPVPEEAGAASNLYSGGLVLLTILVGEVVKSLFGCCSRWFCPQRADRVIDGHGRDGPYVRETRLALPPPHRSGMRGGGVLK